MSIFARIAKSVLGSEEELVESPATQDNRAAVALGVLLFHIAHANNNFDEKESEFIVSTLKSEYGYDDAGAQKVLSAAHACHEDRIEIYSFVQDLVEACKYENRLKIVERLCRLGLAEGGLAHEEEEEIRKIAGLMEVSMTDYGKVKGNVIREK